MATEKEQDAVTQGLAPAGSILQELFDRIRQVSDASFAERTKANRELNDVLNTVRSNFESPLLEQQRALDSGVASSTLPPINDLPFPYGLDRDTGPAPPNLDDIPFPYGLDRNLGPTSPIPQDQRLDVLNFLPPGGTGSVPEGFSPLPQPEQKPSQGFWDTLNREVGGAMSRVGDFGNALYDTLPSRGTIHDFFSRMSDASAAIKDPIGFRQLELTRELQRGNIEQARQQTLELKRQHDLMLVEKILASGNPMIVKQKMLEQANIPQATQLSKALKEADYEAFPAYRKYIPEAIWTSFANGTLPHAQLLVWLGHARYMTEKDTEYDAKQAQFELASQAVENNTATHSQRKLVEEYQAEHEKTQAEADALRALAEERRRKPIINPQQYLESGRVKEILGAGGHDPFVTVKKAIEGDPAAQQLLKQARQEADQAESLLTGTKEKAKVLADVATKPVEKNAPLWRNPLNGNPAKSHMTVQQLGDLGYQTVLPQHAEALSRIETVEQNIKNIKESADDVLRKRTGTSLTEIPKGILQSKIIDFKRRFAGDPTMATITASLNTMLATLAKLAGDAQNIAVEEQGRYKEAIFDDSDTIESMLARIQVVQSANHNMQRKMGLKRTPQELVKSWLQEGVPGYEIKRRLLALENE